MTPLAARVDQVQSHGRDCPMAQPAVSLPQADALAWPIVETLAARTARAALARDPGADGRLAGQRAGAGRHERRRPRFPCPLRPSRRTRCAPSSSACKRARVGPGTSTSSATAPASDPRREAAWLDALSPFYAEAGLAPPALPLLPGRSPFDAAAADLLAEFRPPVVSFHFIAGARLPTRASSPGVARYCRARPRSRRASGCRRMAQMPSSRRDWRRAATAASSSMTT